MGRGDGGLDGVAIAQWDEMREGGDGRRLTWAAPWRCLAGKLTRLWRAGKMEAGKREQGEEDARRVGNILCRRKQTRRKKK